MIDAISAASSVNSAPNQSQGTPRVNATDFMTLLTTQLRNQNPLEPANDSEFLSQLAQFASLEQAQAQGVTLEEVASSLRASAGLQGLSQATNLIGRQITYYDPDLDKDVSAIVESVKFANGTIQLETGQTQVPLGNVVSVTSAPPASPASPSSPPPSSEAASAT